MTKQEQDQKKQQLAFEAQQKLAMKNQRESLKGATEDAETKARYWEAQVRVMKASMEYEALFPDYQAHQERMKAQEAETLKRFQEQILKNQEEGLVAEDPAPQIEA